MKMAFVTTAHHSYYTTGVTEKTVGHGPTDAGEANLPVRASVTFTPADACATPSKGTFLGNLACKVAGYEVLSQTSTTIDVVTAKKMVFTRQSTRALTVTSGMSRGTSGGNGPYRCTPVRTPMIGNRAAGYVVNSSGSMGSVRVFTHDLCGWAMSVLTLCCGTEGDCSRFHKSNIPMSQVWQWCRTTIDTQHGQWCPM